MLDAQVLEEGQRRLAEHGLHAPLQGARADRERVRRVVQREAPREALAGPALEALDQRIGMREVVGNDVLRLRGPLVDQHQARHQRGGLGARLPHQPQCQIEMPHRRAGRDHAARGHHHARLVEPYPRIALAEQRRQRPHGGGLLAVEQAGLGQQEARDAGAAHAAALRMPAAQHGHGIAHVAPAQRLDQARGLLGVERGHQHPVGLAQRVGRVHHHGQAMRRADALAHANHAQLERRPRRALLGRHLVGRGEQVEEHAEAGVEHAIERQDRDLHHGANDTNIVIYDHGALGRTRLR